MIKKKILITGAAGFIGSHLVEHLLSKGLPTHLLRLLIPKDTDLKNLPKESFDIVWGDIRDKKVVKEAVNGVNWIYHLAAKVDFDGKKYQEYEEVNVGGTSNLLEASKNGDIEKFIFFSSIAVYGMPADVGRIINLDETHPHTFTNFYGRSKSEAEELVKQAHDRWNIPYIIIRPASVYGTRDVGPTLGLYKAINNGSFIMIGNGKNKMHYVFVKDLVEGAYDAQISNVKRGDYIIAGLRPTSSSEVVKCIARSIDKKIPGFSVPRQVALIGSYPFGILKSMTGLNIPIYPFRVKTITSTYYYSIDKARKEIGYNPKVDFKSGAKITGEWYKENGYI